MSKPRCWIQALTPASGALAGPQPIAPPRPFSCEDVIFLFLSPALPPPSLSLSSFSFLIPLSSPPPLLFSHRYVPLALKGIGFPLWTPPSHFRLPRRSPSSPLPSFLARVGRRKMHYSVICVCVCERVVFFLPPRASWSRSLEQISGADLLPHRRKQPEREMTDAS